MVVMGQPKTQNPNENKGAQNESWIAFKNSYTLKNDIPKSITIGWLSQIWLPSDGS